MDEYEQLEELKQENQELNEEIERLSRINKSLLRQIKERSNVAKGQFPKKQHSGYSLVSSMQKEYRYYDGNNKVAYIFETVFQTPYSFDITYEDVLELILEDLIKEDDERPSIISSLGFTYLIGCRSCKDLYRNDDYKDLFQEYEEIYKKKTGTEYLYAEDYSKIRRALEKDISSSCYNLNARMNGKAGYWEMSINHLEPIKDLPTELMFPIRKKKRNDGSKEKEDK